MKAATIITGLCLLFGVAVSHAATTGQTRVLTRISDETGVPMETLETQKSATGLGNGELETANLLANASGKSFDEIVAAHQAGEGWGKIAHDNGLNLGKIVSEAHRSDQGALHSQNARSDQRTLRAQSGDAQSQHVRGKSSGHNGNAPSLNKLHGSTMKAGGHGRTAKPRRGAPHAMGHRGR